MTSSTPTIIVIIGITGDLARRKLLPAINRLAAAGALPRQLRIVGITRRADVEINSLIDTSPDAAYLRDHIELFPMQLEEAGDYDRLSNHLQAIEAKLGSPAQRLFYLSVPPQVSRPIIGHLGTSGLAGTHGTKLLLEKPFGTDLASAAELADHIGRHFEPGQVYRIDHYLAKEMAQNFIVFRQSNLLFNRTWNKDFIQRIDIIASEAIGIEGRAAFYEQTGALRDVVQSHLMQLAALTLMELPPSGQLSDVPAQRLATLQQLALPAGRPVSTVARRGQYASYRSEVANPDTATETFVDLTLASADPRWTGVPVRLVAGKALADKVTEVRITYRADEAGDANQLTLRLQPDEGVEFDFWTKVPGYARKVARHSLRFAYEDHFTDLPEAYEQVFLDAINSDHSLFASSDEVIESWRILDPLQAAWAMDERDLIYYAPGTSFDAVVTDAAK